MAHNAPGKHYRRGLSMVELTKMFPDDEAAERWFVKTRWPNGVACPKCGSFDIQERKTRKPQPYHCRDCRKYFSVKTDSLMHNSPMGCQTWALAIYLLNTNIKGISSMRLHRELGITQKSAWHLAHRIRENFHDHQSSSDRWKPMRRSWAARSATNTRRRSCGLVVGRSARWLLQGSRTERRAE